MADKVKGRLVMVSPRDYSAFKAVIQYLSTFPDDVTNRPCHHEYVHALIQP